jgi:hypothetical protein
MDNCDRQRIFLVEKGQDLLPKETIQCNQAQELEPILSCLFPEYVD